MQGFEKQWLLSSGQRRCGSGCHRIVPGLEVWSAVHSLVTCCISVVVMPVTYFNDSHDNNSGPALCRRAADAAAAGGTRRRSRRL